MPFNFLVESQEPQNFIISLIKAQENLNAVTALRIPIIC